jgi:hypothetical protein
VRDPGGEASVKDADERVALADFCTKKSLRAAAARFYGEAFAADVALAETGKTVHRYNTACAALVGSRKREDDPMHDDAARAGLRAKALGWLRDDLAAWGKILDGGNPKGRPVVAQQLARWTVDTDLAGIRDEPELAKLPEAEREAFRSRTKSRRAEPFLGHVELQAFARVEPGVDGVAAASGRSVGVRSGVNGV